MLNPKAVCTEKRYPKHKKKFGPNELKRWKKALEEVARVKGWDLIRKGYFSCTSSQGQSLQTRSVRKKLCVALH